LDRVPVIRQLRARHAPKSRYFEGRPERAEIAGSQGVRAVGCLPVGDPKLSQVIPGGREPRRAINEREEALDPAVGQFGQRDFRPLVAQYNLTIKTRYAQSVQVRGQALA
jgi:hypothetical protein